MKGIVLMVACVVCANVFARPGQPPPPRHHHGPHGADAAVAAGIIGGALVGAALIDAVTKPDTVVVEQPVVPQPVVVPQTVVQQPVAVPQPIVVQQPAPVVHQTVVVQPVTETRKVWVEGRYVEKANAYGSSIRVFEPGHYEERTFVVQ